VPRSGAVRVACVQRRHVVCLLETDLRRTDGKMWGSLWTRSVTRTEKLCRCAAGAASFCASAGVSAGCAGGAERVDSIAVPYWCGDTIPSGVYTPYPEPGAYPSGPVGPSLPWRGPTTQSDPPYPHPAGVEDFEAYSNLPVTLECDSDKSRRAHLDVTKGCLDAVLIEGTAYRRGKIRLTPTDPGFRALALSYTSSDLARPIKWTDQRVEYRFYQIGGFLPDAPDTAGFHVFARYRTENDLYVASWRKDGNVTIKEKLCGNYTPLAQATIGPWAPGTWHRLRFEASGQNLRFYVDNVLRLAVTDGTFSWGTAGVRIDYADAYIDDWSVTSAPQP
jgi:hypothetical protein